MSFVKWLFRQIIRFLLGQYSYNSKYLLSFVFGLRAVFPSTDRVV